MDKNFVMLISEYNAGHGEMIPLAVSLHKENLIKFTVEKYGLNEQKAEELRAKNVTWFKKPTDSFTEIWLTIYTADTV